ncbi:MAG TPA: alpha/beta hydrolase [Acidimicrobiales bacterium]|nr:alpha/beta hydrolase [Acidimicrobiales bacterium]
MSNKRRAGVRLTWPSRGGGNEVRQALRRRRPGVMARVGLAAAALLATGLASASQAATLAATLRGHLLSAGDLPYGWSVAPVTSTKVQVTTSPCGEALVAVLDPAGVMSALGLAQSPLGPTYATASFIEGSGLPSLSEVLASGAQAEEAWQRLGATLAGCRAATFVYKGTKVTATGAPLAFTHLGHSSSAYAWTIREAGAPAGSDVDLVLFRTASYYGYLSYLDAGPLSVPTVTAFARAAVAKATTGSTAPVPDSVSIASVPVQTVHTTLGTVAYRAIGHGPALVMIAGWSGTMEGWDPLLVNALAQHHRVVIFDNAGIGRTQSLLAPLTVDAMADQTAALIDALGLGRPDVLGWSMGTTVAQALAVLYPSEVGALVLCAPYPGTGAVVLPPASILDATNDPTALFPANQVDAEIAYNLAISSYPKAPPAPQATDSAQLQAVHQWWAGADPTGRLVDQIAVPTLLADGTADRLDPVANAHLLARLIPGATLKLYPDAGHAFLFQDYTAFAVLVDSFLRQAKSH